MEDKCDTFIFFTMFLAQYFVEDIFFLPCYMTCYNFCKLVKAKGRSRNFAISKMGLFVTLVYGFQSSIVVINSSILEFKGFFDPFLIVQ